MPPGDSSRALKFNFELPAYATEPFCALSGPVPMGNQSQMAARDPTRGWNRTTKLGVNSLDGTIFSQGPF